MKHFVYLFAVRCWGHLDALIKVGESKDVVDRQRTLGNGAIPASEYRLLAVIRGSKEDQDVILRYFKEFQAHGEYFYPKAPLLDYIRWLREMPYVAFDYDGIDSIPARYFDEWMPKSDRVRELQRSLIPPSSWDEVFPVPEITGDDFWTDAKIAQAASRVMGGIDLDPASHPFANFQNIHAKHFYYDGELHGLNQPWYGNVFLNPPFSRWKDFAKKTNDELDRGEVKQLCLYTGANTMGNKYMARLKSRSDRHVLGDGRWKHWGPKSYTGSPFVSYVFYYGPNVDRFEEEFSAFGHVFKLARDLRATEQDFVDWSLDTKENPQPKLPRISALDFAIKEPHE